MGTTSFFKTFAASVLLTGALTGAQAATINLSVGTSGGAGLGPGFFTSQDGETEEASLRRSTSGSETGIFGFASAEAEASANSETGELRLYTEAARQGEPCNSSCAPSAGGDADASITETFILNGSGQFSALMDYDAFWNSEDFGFVAEVIINLPGIGFSDFANFDSLTSPTIGLANGSLAVSEGFDVVDETVSVTWRILGSNNAEGNGTPSTRSFLDASNTALISFSTTGTLTATPSSSAFLSDARYGAEDDLSAVPLPGALPGLLGGMLVLGAVARRRKAAITDS